MKPYVLFVVEDGEQQKQWAVRVDHLLLCLAGGVLCSLFVVAVPWLQSTVPAAKRWGASRQEIKSGWTPRSGVYAGRTAIENGLGRR